MVVLSRLAALVAPAPRHAEVKDHVIVAIGRYDAIFGAPRQARDRRPGQTLRQGDRKGTAQVGADGADGDEPQPSEEGREAAHGGFDFGQVGPTGLAATPRWRARPGPDTGPPPTPHP